MIGIIDYGVGNLRSVQKALQAVGAPAAIIASPAALTPGTAAALAPAPGIRTDEPIDKLILPGVGAFADGMGYLRERGWIEPVKRWIAEDRPLLGVCLGMQLLFEGSEEDAPPGGPLVEGLGILPGIVVRFREEDAPKDSPHYPGGRIKVPHMGWNTLTWTRPDPLLAGLKPDSPSLAGNASVYFVHGFHAQPRESPGNPLTSATAEYGKPFCATVWRGNLWATQFHPEKSQRVGLRMLANFAAV
jgi:glutamine amidotransferase